MYVLTAIKCLYLHFCKILICKYIYSINILFFLQKGLFNPVPTSCYFWGLEDEHTHLFQNILFRRQLLFGDQRVLELEVNHNLLCLFVLDMVFFALFYWLFTLQQYLCQGQIQLALDNISHFADGINQCRLKPAH